MNTLEAVLAEDSDYLSLRGRVVIISSSASEFFVRCLDPQVGREKAKQFAKQIIGALKDTGLPRARWAWSMGAARYERPHVGQLR